MTEHIKMTNTPPRIQYIANGDLKTYDIPFAFFKETDIRIFLNEQELSSTEYQIEETSENNYAIVLNDSPENGTTITIQRQLDIERVSDFQEGGTLRANVLNNELDYQTACIQQVADELNRSMVLPPYVSGTDLNLTLPFPEAGKAIVWDSTGKNLENSLVAVNDIENSMREQLSATQEAASTATQKAQQASSSANEAAQAAQTATTAAQNAVNQVASVQNDLNNKADLSLDNINVAGKTKLLHNVMPNYNAGVSMASDVSHYATTDGWIYAFANGSDLIDVKFAVSADNVNWTTITQHWARTNNNCGFIIPMPSGQYFKWERYSHDATILFFPCKGAV